jgi:hypothetical protein
MTNKPFGIYYNDTSLKVEESDSIYQLLKPYKTMDKAMQAFKDLCRTPKNKRSKHYVILPIKHIGDKALKVNADYKDELKKILK